MQASKPGLEALIVELVKVKDILRNHPGNKLEGKRALVQRKEELIRTIQLKVEEIPITKANQVKNRLYDELGVCI